MSALSKYEEALMNAPARGGGLHQAIMSIACLGVLAEIPASDIVNECNSRLDGIKRGEANEAVEKAMRTVTKNNDWRFEKKKESKYAPKLVNPLGKFINGYPTDLISLSEASPVDVFGLLPDSDAEAVLEALYGADEWLYIGDTFGREIKQVKDWLKEDLAKYPHIIPNPMTGDWGITGTGKASRRCEETVKELRFAVMEMDDVPLDQQVAFWMKCIELKLPVAAVIHSGSKSLHGWMKVDCGSDHAKWERSVKGWLFNEFGVKYGIDRACSNKARLSRLPSHYREGKSQQRLLYLNGDA